MKFLNWILGKIFGLTPYTKGKYDGVSFKELKEKFMPVIDLAYAAIADLPEEIQGNVIGSGIDGNGPFVTIHNKTKSRTKKLLVGRLKVIEHLTIKYGEIPRLA